LKNKSDIVFKKKENLSVYFEKAKKDFDSHKLVCKSKSSKMILGKMSLIALKRE